MNAMSSIFAFQLGPALASVTMDALIWLPFWIGIMLLLLAVPVILLVPVPQEGQERSSEGEETLLASTDPPSAKDSISTHIASVKEILTSHPRNFTLLLTSFFLTSLASSDTKLLPQYISKRYRWRFVLDICCRPRRSSILSS